MIESCRATAWPDAPTFAQVQGSLRLVHQGKPIFYNVFRIKWLTKK